MADMKALWRPEAFSAVGAGFVGDKTLRDGVHLRWRSDYRFGLPYEMSGLQNGTFRIYVQGQGTIVDADLFGYGANVYPYCSSLSGGWDYGNPLNGNRLTFWKRVNPDIFAIFWKLRLQFRLLRPWLQWRFSPEERRFLDYAQTVAGKLEPDLTSDSLTRENSDACAVDLRYQSFSGSGPLPSDRHYINFVGLDRNDRVVTTDWIGLLKSGSPKRTARLRAAGITSVDIQRVPGSPYINIEEVRWVFCEDYCQDDRGWYTYPDFEIRFNADPAYHTPQVTEAIHYAPFHKEVDWGVASDAIAAEFIQSMDLQQMLDQPTTYLMGNYKINFKDPAPEGTALLELPLLQSLIAAGVDPLVARILGMYFYAEDPEVLGYRDIKVEAEFPFFAFENLDALDQELGEIAYGDPSRQFFRDGVGTLIGTKLCGLVLNPFLSAKPQPQQPYSFTTMVNVTDVPSQTTLDEFDLIVDSRLEVPVDTEETRPYLTPIAYSVERSISGGPFTDVIVDEETTPDVFDEIGILPPVYFPQKDAGVWASPQKIADDFTLPALQSESVQYRLHTFDILGRSSVPTDGTKEPVPLPCREPVSPANLSGRIYREGDILFMEVVFSLAGQRHQLEAAWQQVEITLHRLPLTTSGLPKPPAEVQWIGDLPGRRLLIQVDTKNQLLFPTLSQSCVLLQWVGDDLQRTPTPEGDCSEFPPVVPALVELDPDAMDFATTGFRTYRLQIAVASYLSLLADIHRWCARVRVEGKCQDSGQTLFSLEPCVPADRVVTPPPPVLPQPITADIPTSTYPDSLGDSYYSIDLAAYGLNDGDLINLYVSRLDRLTSQIDTLVDGNLLLDQTAFLNLAKASKRSYELLTPEPFEYNAANRFYRVKVPGELRQYHVVGIIGTNPYLEERDWTNHASIVLFTTPGAVPIPSLAHIKTEPFAEAGQSKARLEYELSTDPPPDPNAPVDPALLPKVQILRRDLSTNSRSAVYVGEAVGSIETIAQDEAVYRFRFTDQTMEDWRRYEYHAYLVFYQSQRSEFVKSQTSVVSEALAAWGGVRVPIGSGYTNPMTSASVNGWDEVIAVFEAGDFDLSLTKVLSDNQALRTTASIRAGRVLASNPDDFQLEMVRVGSRLKYRLTMRFHNVQTGRYTLRLTFKQEKTWSHQESE